MNCNTTTYKIQVLKYSPTVKRNNLTTEDQQRQFVKIVQKWVNENPDKHPAWFLNEFVSPDPLKGGYWNTVPDGKNKTQYFLLPKKDRDKWSTGGRLAYAKRTFYRNDPRWKQEEEKKVYTPPKKKNIDYGRIDYSKRQGEQSIGEILGAGERLKKSWR